MIKTKTILFLGFILSAFCFAEQGELSVRFMFSIGEKGDQPGQFNHPSSVSSDAYGNIYVADTGNNRVQKFDDKGQLLSFIGGFGWGKEQFQAPHDIFVYNSLDIYIADFENSRIERYDKDLNWITSYYSNENWESRDQFEFPRSIFLSIHGDFFIVDSQNDRISKFNAEFEPQLTFGDFDWGQGVLQKPSHISISFKDIIYVSDSDAGKIRVYDYFGNFLQNIGEGILHSPKGLCTNSEGHIFVADSELNQIFIFNQTGQLLLNFGSAGEKFGAFSEPFDVDAGRNRLIVADTANNRIQVFELYWTH
jgi:tripartite motif-containing protein 71